ncbi:MAG: outer membrane beta-barrel protein [Pseudomonadota bacterium]
MKRFKLCVAAALISLCSTQMAWAAMPYPFGWYLEGDAGKSVASDKSYPGKVYNTGFGWGLAGGYKFNEYVAGEVGFTHYAQTRVKTLAGTTFATDEHYSYDLVGKVILPIAHTGLEIFGKLGVGRIYAYTSLTNPQAANANGYFINTGVHSHNALYLGGGAEYAILKNLLANVQWQRAKGTNQTGDVDLYSAGLAYIF